MNKQRMLMLADLLEEIKEHQFNIEYWVSQYDPENESHSSTFDGDDVVDYSVYKCDSAACVAGWAVALKNDMEVKDQNILNIEEEAAEYLGLTREDARKLFFFESHSVWRKYSAELGYTDTYLPPQITAVDAAHVIRRIVDGEWSLS